MLPNAIAPIIVNASLNLSGFIVAEAALSFLGFGIQDPIPTWGNMLAATQQFMFERPWLPLVQGMPIVLCSLPSTTSATSCATRLTRAANQDGLVHQSPDFPRINTNLHKSFLIHLHS